MKFEPCPFCGNEPRHLPYKYGYHTERIICDSCNFYLPPDVWEMRNVRKARKGEGE